MHLKYIFIEFSRSNLSINGLSGKASQQYLCHGVNRLEPQHFLMYILRFLKTLSQLSVWECWHLKPFLHMHSWKFMQNVIMINNNRLTYPQLFWLACKHINLFYTQKHPWHCLEFTWVSCICEKNCWFYNIEISYAKPALKWREPCWWSMMFPTALWLIVVGFQHWQM